MVISRVILGVVLLLLPWHQALAIPKIKTEFKRNNEGFMRIKVINETIRVLACYVAIDGRRVKFRLPPRGHSKWYKATDKRYNAKNFSTWCDYIELHPEYEKYVF
ncbi:hypothetical protein HII17_04200 [Thalassotalea sp. M1531]|uniref:Uncharacterized protein n=1 Tax=Thalassotalea algicola TaxID=2716224 RepID=A0A7Y0Q630_9GAMM|nr:hypothetical protein [Thalassotalea algicola]NMP30756.1 hypothetical protein [Thalassotalea algicola]